MGLLLIDTSFCLWISIDKDLGLIYSFWLSPDGSNSVFYKFMRIKFHWTVKQFTEYETVGILVPAVAGSGGVLFIWSLRKVSCM